MKHRIAALLCAVGVTLAVTAPAMASEAFYPISVDSCTVAGFDQPCIKKVYQLSL